MFEEGDAALTARVQAMLGKVSVPRALDRPHRLIAELLAEDEARLEKRARAAHPSILDAPTFDTPLERRLRLLNGPFPALGRAGGKPSLNRAGRDGRVQVGQSSVPVVLERIAASPRTRPGLPTPKTTETLALTIAGDGGSGPGVAGRRWCPDRGPRGDHRRGHHGRGRSAPPP
ncbi:hypothetical protein ABAZ39_13080 [Azospirillum argentinense]|uniref:Uncharacterized protein n=1 Tax=Azospirillum argentinense TaxID=2970906 RepID=A0A060DP88_9PROT|nr:hypothetical protein [Azospirillum argentinense]AIB12903.1 hypothetical protein ABAZ39_13080 [Azospirillum argentinense]EZQ09899.1 hypothetical protein ABAZ39_14490 [Azospirillum argentinense]